MRARKVGVVFTIASAWALLAVFASQVRADEPEGEFQLRASQLATRLNSQLAPEFLQQVVSSFVALVSEAKSNPNRIEVLRRVVASALSDGFKRNALTPRLSTNAEFARIAPNEYLGLLFQCYTADEADCRLNSPVVGQVVRSEWETLYPALPRFTAKVGTWRDRGATELGVGPVCDIDERQTVVARTVAMVVEIVTQSRGATPDGLLEFLWNAVYACDSGCCAKRGDVSALSVGGWSSWEDHQNDSDKRLMQAVAMSFNCERVVSFLTRPTAFVSDEGVAEKLFDSQCARPGTINDAAVRAVAEWRNRRKNGEALPLKLSRAAAFVGSRTNALTAEECTEVARDGGTYGRANSGFLVWCAERSVITSTLLPELEKREPAWFATIAVARILEYRGGEGLIPPETLRLFAKSVWTRLGTRMPSPEEASVIASLGGVAWAGVVNQLGNLSSCCVGCVDSYTFLPPPNVDTPGYRRLGPAALLSIRDRALSEAKAKQCYQSNHLAWASTVGFFANRALADIAAGQAKALSDKTSLLTWVRSFPPAGRELIVGAILLSTAAPSAVDELGTSRQPWERQLAVSVLSRSDWKTKTGVLLRLARDKDAAVAGAARAALEASGTKAKSAASSESPGKRRKK